MLFDELTVSPLSVHHGLGKDGVTPFICWGFRIRDLGYISDASFIPEETRDLIRGCAVLILDSLSDSIKDVGLLSHFSGILFISLIIGPSFSSYRGNSLVGHFRTGVLDRVLPLTRPRVCQ